MSHQLVSHLLDILALSGVQEICLAPGARNALFVAALSHDSRFRVYSWPEERSAAFYGLGLIKATGRPVAIIVTSGTAAGELLPAMMEGYYSALPLIAVTADRPRRFRGTGAPQAVEQQNLFGSYASPYLDIAIGESCDLQLLQDQQQPAHLNVCLEDPRGIPVDLGQESLWQLIKEERGPSHLRQFLASAAHPLVVVGSLPLEQRAAVISFLLALGAPCFLEAPSGLREVESLSHLRLHIVEGFWKRAVMSGYPVDAVLRLGGVPTLRLWRDLDDSQRSCSLLSIDKTPFPGASHGEFICGDIALSLKATPSRCLYAKELFAADRHCWKQRLELFELFPRSEPAIIHALSRLIPSQQLVYLGNSLPIREWDLAASYLHPHPNIGVQRGANGIDGQLSSFFGMCQPGIEAWGIFGDLTALYDLVAFWILRQRKELCPTCVIVNNGGGQIFWRLFHERAFLNGHTLSFESLAQLWELYYERWYVVPDAPLVRHGGGSTLIEVIPDVDATTHFWEEDSLHTL